MKKQYVQSIGLFSYAMPLVLSLGIIGLVLFARSIILGDFAEKQKLYAEEQSQLMALEKLKKESKEKKVLLKQWLALTDTADSFTEISSKLRDAISLNSPTKTLQITQSKKLQSANSAVDAKSSDCEFGIEGTYREIQSCLAQLESTMPNTMLNSMTVKSGDNNKLLDLNLKYTIWEKAQ